MKNSQTNNLWETKENNDGSVTITNYNSKNTKDQIQLEIPSIIDGKAVTAIGDNAFSDNWNIVSVVIPNGVTCIGDYAFSASAILKDVIIPDSVRTVGDCAFSACGSLIRVCFPNGVESIGHDVFEDSESLEQVIIPRSVKSIGEDVFEKRVTIYAPVDSFAQEYALAHKIRFCELSDELFIIKNNSIKKYLGTASVVKVPMGILSIGEFAFTEDIYARNNFVREIILPNSVKTIGQYAFHGCISLKKINLPDSISRINYAAFSLCRSLTSVSLPKRIKTINEHVFSGCSRLIDCNIPDSVLSIEKSAFAYCESLESINIPNGVISIGERAFVNCKNLSNVSIPNSVIKIGCDAFDGNNELKDDILIALPFPNSSGQHNFFYSKNQKRISIPYGVNSIKEKTFEHCINLECIMIPSSVKRISDTAFGKCTNLKMIIGEPGSYVEKWSHKNGVEFTTDPDYITSPSLNAASTPNTLKELEKEWRFIKNEDGTRAIDVYIGQDIHPIIPSMAGKTKVTKILSGVFRPNGYRPIGFRDINIESAVITEGITIIESVAFSGCINLKSVVIPTSVLYVGISAFKNCHQLSAVQIPASVTNIDSEAFKGCEGLADDQGFVIVNGILFDYIGTNSDVIIPPYVTILSDYAICDNHSIKNVVIPHGVKYIGVNFHKCRGLESITVPETVEYMNLQVFDIGKKAKLTGKVGKDGHINELEHLPIFNPNHPGLTPSKMKTSKKPGKK